MFLRDDLHVVMAEVFRSFIHVEAALTQPALKTLKYGKVLHSECYWQNVLTCMYNRYRYTCSVRIYIMITDACSWSRWSSFLRLIFSYVSSLTIHWETFSHTSYVGFNFTNPRLTSLQIFKMMSVACLLLWWQTVNRGLVTLPTISPSLHSMGNISQ